MDREERLAKALLEPFKPKGFCLEIMTLLARELDFNRRDTRYRPPLCILADLSQTEVVSEEEPVLLDSRS